ncbi:MAG: SDR family oxidoreductase [Novosphingobium sp.]|nr:SDR family oxidoreductase [Novosphingobium sp.]MCP5404314.1 SDR family oxidoreductase [Novosphingobium sp.]
MLLQGKVAVVTGAAGNLGSACACEIAKEGAKVVITDLPGTGLEQTAERISEDCGEVSVHEADLTSEKDIKALMRGAGEAFGGIDVLVNVAAFMQGIDKDRDLLTMSSEYWDTAMAVNLRGTMLCCKHAIPVMLERGGGAIVNFGSTAGVLGDVGLFAYSATKAALLSLARSIATTYGKQGIRCNSVCPGSVWTDATKEMMPESMLDMMTRTRLTPRLGLPEDVAAMVAFLASDKAEYVTGQTFMVDGGGTAHQPWVRME